MAVAGNAEVSLSTFTIENKEFYEKALLGRLLDNLFFYKYAKKSTLPRNNGNKISWRTFKPLYTANTCVVLTEGAKPSFATIQMVEFNAALEQLGRAVKLTDLVDYEGKDPVVTEVSGLLGEDCAEVIEDKIIAKLTTSKNVYYADGVANANAVKTGAKKISVADLNAIKRMFKRYNVKPVENGKYIMAIDPEVEMDLKDLTGTNASWIDVVKYANAEQIFNGEIGSFLGFKFIVSNRIPEVSDETGVRKCIAFGADSFGVVELAGGSAKPQIIHKGLGSAGTEDPLDQVQTLGWKINGFTARILHDEGVCVYNVYSGASAVANVGLYNTTPSSSVTSQYKEKNNF